MNFLTLVFSLLIVLSLGVLAIQEKLSGDRRLRTTYLGHIKATRKILSKCEVETYQSFKGIPDPVEEKPKKTNEAPKPAHVPKINPECARLNLWPLIQEGKEEHLALYNLTAKLLATFYPGTGPAFLDLFLKKAREQNGMFAMEKLSLGDPKWQGVYYRMLKGTKNGAYPSLLDLVAVEETPSKVCLSHAHPQMIALFFGPKVAERMFQELHAQEKPPLITSEWIEKICAESHLIALDPHLLDLLELGRPKPHPKRPKTTWIEEDSDSHISLRKTIYRSNN